ncbi:redox-sensitive transcriptional activator SoxR [Deinococcus sp. JMULE3]|uniref:redox-sensitive transcriptional activator SoxR n=1 Tax=Deinococcus sp. JMULE3 TaxID=2518341 RepID=UPI0015776A21|nr:redox-sensitive transcriptional activator SoxR [Deinococcus sp. JMULE3]NTY00146.1 redox-sensitive transcriptional activator SoxR [Deinococcus sp. JMULE3]
MPEPLTPAQLAARSGLSVPSLHHYEREGLISAARTGGNQRRYAPDTLRRLAFIRAAARVGVPLAEIREALSTLRGARPPSAQDWAALSATWRDTLNARIDTLTRLRDDLEGCIACGCLSLDRCALHNPGDRVGRTLPGGSQLLGDR